MSHATPELVMEGIPEEARAPVEEFARLVEYLASDSWLSMVAYGDVTSGRFDPAIHHVRNVLVFSGVDLNMLRELGGQGRRLGKLHIAAPLIMTPDYIASSCDTFPLEFLEVQQTQSVLKGEDFFTGLTFENQHIKLQCEREIKALQVGLRQGLLAAGGDDQFLGMLELNVAQAILRTFRGITYVNGSREFPRTDKAVDSVESLVGSSFPSLRAALDPDAPHGWDEFVRLYRELEQLGTFIDEWS